MPTHLSDETKRAVASELGVRSGLARRERADAVRRIVAATRNATPIPDDLNDIEVLNRAVALIEGGGCHE